MNPNSHRRQCLIALAGFAWGLGATAALAHGDAASEIVHLMKKTFDRPDAPLKVEPVTVVGDAAVAGWLQGNQGGRALLRRKGQTWAIEVCAGDGLTQARVLASTGLPKAQAGQLAEAVRKAEAPLPAATKAQFASFEGMVKVRAGQAPHGPHDAGASHASPRPGH